MGSKVVLKKFLTLIVIASVGMFLFLNKTKNSTDTPANEEVTEFVTTSKETFISEPLQTEQTFTVEDLLSNVKKFVDVPEGGTPWNVFGETEQTPYSYTDEEDQEWSGVRPQFSDNLKKLDGTEILIQGYMFPLGQEEKQSTFLLGPFPVTCPFHYHVTPNLIIEVHAKEPVPFLYDAVNVKGLLELVPKDDEYNTFYRLKNARLIR